TVANGLVYLATIDGGAGDGTFYALNSTNGSIVWFKAGGESQNSPTVADGLVYNVDEKILYAYNATDGTQEWSFNLRANSQTLQGGPPVSKGMLYLTTILDNYTYALNASTGTQIWNFSMLERTAKYPAIANDILYVTTNNNRTYALNATNGTQIWNYTTNGGLGAATVSEGVVFVGSADKSLYALNATTGVYIWESTHSQSTITAASIADEIVYYGSYNDLYAFTNGQDAVTADTTNPTFTGISNVTEYLNATLNLTINATDNVAVDSFSVNNTDNFSINSSGYLTNVTNVFGVYWLNITVNDTAGNENSTIIWINYTTANAAPTTTTIPNVSFTSGGSTTINLSAYFTDPNNDDLNFTNATTGTFTSTIDQDTGVVTISSSTEGTHYSVFTASDSLLTTDSNNVTITVSAAGGGGGGGGGGDEPTEECGDGSCNGDETASSCPSDCDGTCDAAWTCNSWSSCTAGTRTRTCVDLEGCGTTDGKPAESESCTVAPPPCEGDDCEVFSPEVIESVVTTINEADIDGVEGFTTYTKFEGNKTNNTEVPCYESLQEVTLSPTSEEISIPLEQGREIVVDPFELTCDGGAVDLTAAVPYNYDDFEVYVCRGGYCGPVKAENISALVCEDNLVQEYLRTEEIYQPNIETLNQTLVEQTLTLESDSISVGDVSATFHGPTDNVYVAIKGLAATITQPENPSLKIVGLPTQIKIAPPTDLNVSLTLPYKLAENINEETLKIAAFRGRNWRLFDTTINKETKTASIEVDNLTQYLNENNEATFAILGTICVDCLNASLKEVYEYTENSSIAVVLVHGFGSTPASFQAMINDFSLTRQPVDVWTFGYPHNKHIEDNAEEFSELMNVNLNEYEQIIIVAHSLGGVISQYALLDAKETRKPYLKSVEELVLMGVPNQGVHSFESLNTFAGALANTKSLNTLFDFNSVSIQDLKKIRVIERVRGVNYRVVAGTKPYIFQAGPIKISSSLLFNFTETNDGLLTTTNVRTIGGFPVDKICEDYWELYLTHTELNDDQKARMLVGMLVANEVGLDKIDVGSKRYLKINIPDCTTGDKVFVSGTQKFEQATSNYDICEVVAKEMFATPGTCEDSIQNQNEKGIDCGGICAPCFNFKDFYQSTKFLLYFILLGAAIIGGMATVRHFAPAHYIEEEPIFNFRFMKGLDHDVQKITEEINKLKEKLK
ncbi:PQQ-binding-like beta-propeller repeat protein, partial [Candidatus Peregrinibacteria bacterium]|nr:PQQ-binding-like beta-propeller repeat protein [Candidatus Peregrinibacteria bacterium]